MAENEIIITRTINAPREQVFTAFTTPSIGTWWGPDGFTTTTHSMRFEEGGKWEYTMHGPDGTDYPNLITYTEIKRPARIAYNHGENEQHPEQFKAVIAFEDEDGKTKVTLQLILPSAEERERVAKFGAIEGANQTLARLEQYMNEEHTMANTKEIIISREFNAPRELVFKVWTSPEHVKQWWGPEPFTCPHAEIDLRVGGKYLYCMRSPEGVDAWSGGTVKEVVPNERLVVTDYFSDEKGNKVSPTKFGLGPDFPEESTVIITFEEQNGRTRLSIHYAPETQAAYDEMIKAQMVEGWNSSLDKFATLVEKLQE